MKTGKLCELCKEEAFVYCSADSAFLCWNCDNKVHQANFLVARHLRHILCTNCQLHPIRGDWAPAPQSQSLSQYSHHLCKACSFEKNNHSIPSPTPSSSSDCLSTNESSSTDFKPKRMLVNSSSRSRSRSTNSASFSDISNTNKLEGIFAIWCKKLGLNRHSVLPTATTSALRFCLERLPVMPLRLSLAAAFWIGLRMNTDMSFATWQNLRRLEELSGVPAKLIVAMEPRLARAMRLRRRISQDLEEGWAEYNCNV